MKIEVHPHYRHLSDAISTIPSRFDEEGELLFAGRNTIKLFSIDGTELVVKRFRRLGLFKGLIYTFFRKSKAQRAYRNGGRLIQLGFDTPQNIAYIETHRNGLLEYAYYICGVDAAPAIDGRLNEQEDFDKRMASDLAAFLFELHQKGVLHDDFNCSNVLYHPLDNGHYHFSVIDINRMHFFDGMPALEECMENMTRFTGRIDLFTFVAKEYIKCRGMAPESIDLFVNTKKRHDEQWARRKKLLKRFK